MLSLKSQNRSIDRNLLILTILLLLIGLIAIADVSAPISLKQFDDQYWYAKQQMIRVGIGIVVMLFFSKLNYNFFNRFAVYIMGLALLLLLLVLMPWFATEARGAQRWIDLGFFVIQPTEVAKLGLVIYFAKLAAAKKDFLAYLVPLHLIALLVMLQPDLGSTIMIMFIGVSQLYFAQVPIRNIIAMITFDALAAVALTFSSEYRRERLLTFFNQSADPLDRGYHIRQILIALGAGGMWGVGFGQSRQKNFFLPETATDSIFAVIAEEIGFSGSVILILLLLSFVLMLYRISANAPDTFSKIVGFGITAWIGGQIILNLATMVALVPLTGIPLPFISYGGSSIILILAATGIMLNISKHAKR